MPSVDLYIRELLFEYDCVIVPGLGGFLAQSRSSLLFRDKRRIYPPCRMATFNSMLVQDDGLLTSHIARLEKIDYSEASRCIEAFVSECRKVLASGHSVRLEGLGSLAITPEGKLVFHALSDVNFSEATFGMDSIFIHPLTIAPVPERMKKMPIDRKPAEIRKKSPAPVKWTIAVAIPVILFLLYGILFPDSFQRTYFNYSGLVMDLFKSRTITTSSEPPAQISKPVMSVSISQPEPEPEPAAEVTETHKPSAPETKPLPAALAVPKFYIIGGCFGSRENADKFLTDLKTRGFEAEEAGTNKQGHYRISYKSFLQRQEALTYLREIKSGENPGAWLLKY